MLDHYPHEDAHVGELLAGHREALGITQAQLATELGPRGIHVARHIEASALPAYGEVEDHHQALLEVFPLYGGTRPMSLARREQWWATAADAAMWQRAAEANPPVQWWWGTRGLTGERGAYCNLCQSMIHGYDSGRGMTRRARIAVMDHRLKHVNALIENDNPKIKEN
ncbi:MAG TPA: hypothetical protein VHT26_07615 [Trebonia sp.]|nr:hypothetical protein [Trebonia sp.]